MCSYGRTDSVNPIINPNTMRSYKQAMYIITDTYRMSQEECARLREGVPYVKVCRYNPKHLCSKLNCYGDNGPRRVGLLAGPRTVPVS
jgi:hypothetical protein